jgi:S1-C subfamily serine protease
LANLTLEKSTSLGLSATSGALVELLEPNGTAEQVAVRIDDVITALNGAPISKAMDVRMEEHHLALGSTAELLISRQGQLVKVRVKLPRRRRQV